MSTASQVQSVISLLQQKGHFLSLSREQPEYFSEEITFTLNNGTSVKITDAGIVSFEPPVTSNKHIVLSCGVHGNETAPIEICDDMVQRILTGDLVLAHRVLFLFGNLPAMDIAERFVEENMNRLFNGAHSEGEGCNNAERIRARALENAIEQFYGSADINDTKLHYDLHTAIRESKNEKFAVYPFLHERNYNLEQLGFLAACGVKTILLSENPTTTFSYFSSVNFNAHAFTVELGKVRPFGQNDMSRFEAAKSALVSLVSLSDFSPTVSLDDLDIFRVNQVINRHEEDFVLHFDDDMPNFTGFAKGELLASETGREYRAEFEGEAIVFPNAKVALGQRALLTVIPTDIENFDN